MVNLIKKEVSSNYYYGSYINYKAFRDFHVLHNIDDQYFKPNHCIILAFIIENFHKNEKMPRIKRQGVEYALMNNNFILDNLIYLRIKKRQLFNCINSLVSNGLLSYWIESKTNRYINVNNSLIELCYNVDWTMRPTIFLRQHQPFLWKGFVNEWSPYFNSVKDFKNFIDDFNDERDIRGYKYNTKYIYEHLINSVQYRLKRKVLL